jgi:predicted phage terminase large subunit-like protein
MSAALTVDDKRRLLYAFKAKARLNLLPFIMWTKPDYDAGWFHYEVATKLDQFLQDVVDRKSPRLMIMAPPRHGKSELVSRRFPAYALGRYPDLTFIATSYSNDLASMMNRDVQKIIDQEEYAELFPQTTLSGSSVRTVTAKGSFLRNSEQFEIVDHKGAYKSAGVGTGVTGRGARVLMIDDPVKDAQEAYSTTTRQSIWDWYESTLKTRCEPGGGILLIQCMVGGTPVLMADGTEKPLASLKVGDEIATYRDGALSTAFIKHWKSQGSDYVFAIRTTSGRIVKANERHPFLVRRNGELEWTRLANLRVSDPLVSVTPPGSGGSGLAKYAQRMDATSLLSARGIAPRTTVRHCGPAGTDRHLSTQWIAEPGILDTDTVLSQSTLPSFSNSKKAGAPSAESCQKIPGIQSTGAVFCALTTTGGLERSEGYCATLATSLLDAEIPRTPREYCSRPSSTYDFTEDEIISIEPAGYEEVFDIEVAETENFIANGLVSHNTRWHSDDLAGRLLTAMAKGGEQWEVVKYPAIAEEDEKYRRKGEALHPARYPLEALNRIRYGSGDIDEVGTGSRVWASLYQQRPSAAEGVIFLRDNWKYVSGPPAELRIGGDEVDRLKVFFQLEQIIQYWDTAAGGKQSNDNAACVTMGVAKNGYIMLDLFCEKIEFPELERKVEQLYDKWRPSQVGVEGGGSATGKTVIQTLSRLTRIPFVEVVHSTDKVLRANVASPIQESGLVRILKGTRWAHDFVESCATFPNAVNDDDVDAFMGALELANMRRAPLKISKSLLTAVGG